MEENRNEINGGNGADAPRTYGEESQMYASGQPAYNQQSNYGQPSYSQQPNYGQWGYPGGYSTQPEHGPVTDVFCYILIALLLLRAIFTFFTTATSFAALDYESIQNGTYMWEIANNTSMLFALLNNLTFVATIVLFLFDILKIYKQNYKITGLILFAIFLNPGYYIWRAHVLGRKKAFPIVYTIIYSLLLILSMAYAFYMSFQMVFEMMKTY